MMLAQMLDSWMRMERKSLRETSKLIGVDHSTLHRFVNEKNVEAEPFGKILRWALSNQNTKPKENHHA
jgi:hypothetical protein